MSFDPERYTHKSDKAALKALQAIPGFSLLIKGFMNIWNERQGKILNMSTRIKLGENQMKKYYDMLPPICEKLGIPVPDLYLEMNVNPNAYTYGDTAPFIVLTSGLLDTIPDELVPTVLAHECGHIACKHSLYLTMGRTVLSGASNVLGSVLKLGGLLTVPLQVAFYYWMRCSEFSADRAAVLCDGTARKSQEVCMRLAGWKKENLAEGSIDAFLQQAADYREMITGSAWNKTLEFMVLSQASHPLLAVRAAECGEWERSEQYSRIMNNLPEDETNEEQDLEPEQEPQSAPAEENPAQTVEQKISEAFDSLFGFLNKDNTQNNIPDTHETTKTTQPTEQTPEETKQAEETANELRWYRKMVEEGLITREQYERKERELLGK